MRGEPFTLASDEYFWILLKDEDMSMASFGGTRAECECILQVYSKGIVVRQIVQRSSFYDCWESWCENEQDKQPI
jgi:hypothetical protein